MVVLALHLVVGAALVAFVKSANPAAGMLLFFLVAFVIPFAGGAFAAGFLLARACRRFINNER